MPILVISPRVRHLPSPRGLRKTWRHDLISENLCCANGLLCKGCGRTQTECVYSKMESIKRSVMYLIKTLVLILPLVLRVGISDKYIFRCSYFYRTEKTGIPVGNEVKCQNELLEVKSLHGLGWEVLSAQQPYYQRQVQPKNT